MALTFMIIPMRSEARDSLILLFGTGLTTGLGMLYSIYVARTLGPSNAADFFMALSLVAFCQIALGPINATVTRFTAQYAAHNEYGKIRSLYREVARRVATYGLLGIPLMLVLLKPLGQWLQFESIWTLVVCIAMLFGLMLLSVARGVIRGVQRFSSHNLNIVVEAASRLVIGLIILQWYPSATLGLSAYVAALVITLWVSKKQLQNIWAGYDPAGVDGQAIKRFTAPMFIMMITSAGFQNIDMLFTKHYFTDVEAGLYGASFTLARSISALVTPFTTLLLPLLSTLHSRGERMLKPFLRVCGYFLILAIVPMLLFGLWPENIMQLLYGDAFAGSAEVLFPLAMVRLIGYLCHMLALAYASMNRFRFLYIYAPGLIIQCIWLGYDHDSVMRIVQISLLVQSAVLIAMIIFWFVERNRSMNEKPG